MFDNIPISATDPSKDCTKAIFSLSFFNREMVSYFIINKNEGQLPKSQIRSVQVVKNILACFLIVLTLNFCLSPSAVSKDKNDLSISSESNNMVVKQGVMCEGIKDRAPYNPGVIFSSSLGSVACFTEFELLSEKTVIYHKYYFRDNLSAKKKLTLNPPNWATYSSIQLRETDKGPWRVEIVDTDDNILYILRFSVTD